MKRLEFLGIEVDEKANAKRGVAEFISTPTSRVAALMIPTNEELMIARDVKTIIEAKIEKEKLAPVVIKSHSN